MYRKYFENEEVPPVIRRKQRQAFANMYFTTAGYFIHGGDRAAARRMGLRAARSDPGRTTASQAGASARLLSVGGRNRRPGAP